ncbi:MAG: hypothetical protein LBO09_08150 [Candidatus Peribacteria bacterium]|nr:hypothetical protein [Candidatus Peribacteria bacterium]
MTSFDKISSNREETSQQIFQVNPVQSIRITKTPNGIPLINGDNMIIDETGSSIELNENYEVYQY